LKINAGKTIRLGDLVNPGDGHSVIIDTSIPASIGAVEGLLHFDEAVAQINTICDGIVVNPGQLEHRAELLGGAHRAAPMVRMDWTNYYRTEDFCLPAKMIHRVMISSVADALDSGATAGVVRYLMGFNDEFEAENVRSISLTAKEAYRESLPIFVELCPIGEKVNQHNFEGTIQLGVACMLEIGADGIIIPECSPAMMQAIGSWADIPVILRLSEIPGPEKLAAIFQAGLSGILLSEEIFRVQDYAAALKELFFKVHTRS